MHYVFAFQVVSFLLAFPPIIYAFLFSIHATWPVFLLLLDLIILIMVRKTYKLCGSSLCSLFQPPVISSHLGPNILLSTLFSKALMSENKFHTHTEPQAKLVVL
jgi:hypothetical protein